MGQSQPLPSHTIPSHTISICIFISIRILPYRFASPGPSPSPISIAALIAKALNIPTRNHKKIADQNKHDKNRQQYSEFLSLYFGFVSFVLYTL